jgi:hypothetical protein
MAELLGAAGDKAFALLLAEYGGLGSFRGDYFDEAVAAHALSVEKARDFLKSSVGWRFSGEECRYAAISEPLKPHRCRVPCPNVHYV